MEQPTVWRVPDLPVRRWLAGYDRGSLPRDLLAGAVVTALTIPQALGYAVIAGVPVQVGLVAIPVALLAYAVLGSSPHVMVGPVSTVSVVSGSLVAAHAGGDPDRAVAVTVMLAVLSGLWLLAAGVLRLGWVADFLSTPIVSGFVFGLSVVIVLGQLPALLGLPPLPRDTLQRVTAVVAGLPAADPTTVLVGLVSLAVLFVGARVAPLVPWGLALVVAALVASEQLGLAERGVVVVGEVPRALPVPGLPDLALAEVSGLVVGAAGLALVGLAESLSAARTFAARGGYRVDTDQEFVATGAANVAVGLTGGLGVAGSLSKTAAAVRAGGATQITSLVAAALSLGVLVAFAPALSLLPVAVLAAIVVHAVWGLMDVAALRRYAQVRRNDLVSALAALAGVLLLGTLAGLLVAVGLSVLGLVYRSSRVEVEQIGRIAGEKAAWGSVRRHPERRTIDGILILRLSAPLFWVNAARVEEQVIAHVDAHPSTRALVLDLEASSQLDTTSLDMLVHLLDRLDRRGVELYLVRVMHPVRALLRRTGVFERIGEDHQWRTISQGVRSARRDHGIHGWADEHDTDTDAHDDDDDDTHDGDDRHEDVREG